MKDDLLADSAKLYHVEVKALRSALVKAEKEKDQKKKAGKLRRRKNRTKPHSTRG